MNKFLFIFGIFLFVILFSFNVKAQTCLDKALRINEHYARFHFPKIESPILYADLKIELYENGGAALGPINEGPWLSTRIIFFGSNEEFDGNEEISWGFYRNDLGVEWEPEKWYRVKLTLDDVNGRFNLIIYKKQDDGSYAQLISRTNLPYDTQKGSTIGFDLHQTGQAIVWYDNVKVYDKYGSLVYYDDFEDDTIGINPEPNFEQINFNYEPNYFNFNGTPVWEWWGAGSRSVQCLEFAPEENEEVISCADSQRIIRLSSWNNSHSELWNQNNYPVEICYDKIFGKEYTGENPHDCTYAYSVAYNDVVSINNETNALANIKKCYVGWGGMYWNGYIKVNTTKSGMQNIEINASGTEFDGWPHMQLKINNSIIKEWDVSSSEYNVYTADNVDIGSNPSNEVEIVFTNDKFNSTLQKDRNLYVRYVKIGDEKISTTEKREKYCIDAVSYYNFKVCYGDLYCLPPLAYSNCPKDFKLVLSLYNMTGSNAAVNSAPLKICCKSPSAITTARTGEFEKLDFFSWFNFIFVLIILTLFYIIYRKSKTKIF